MTLWEAIFLGALQGVTEFLPISSSGHLVLAQHFLGWGEKKNAAHIFFDGMLHWGTVLSLIFYYQKDVRSRLRSHSVNHMPGTAPLQRRPGAARVLFLIVLASLPAAAVTLLLDRHITASFHNPRMVATDFLLLGLVLLVVDRSARGSTSATNMRWWQAAVIGLGQALSAVFRGLSRSGMTIASALVVGLERGWAVRFSFMMSVVASLGLGVKGIWDAARDPDASHWLTPQFLALTVVATAVSAAVGYLAIAVLIQIVQRARLWWFAFYLWAVALGVWLSQMYKPLD